jgi:hypothetical protein
MARRNNYGDISEEQYLTALAWLEGGGTKKGACDILKVSNNKTMERLLDEYQEDKIRDKELRARKRSQPVTTSELVEIIKDYLNGYSLEALSASYYRSVDMIKHQLYKHGAMLRTNAKVDPLNPPPMPDQCFEYNMFTEGQYVWSSKHGCIAQIKSKYKNAWRVEIMSEGRQEQSYVAEHELGSLEHLERLGVDLSSMTDYLDAAEVKASIYKTMREANKNARKTSNER